MTDNIENLTQQSVSLLMPVRVTEMGHHRGKKVDGDFVHKKWFAIPQDRDLLIPRNFLLLKCERIMQNIFSWGQIGGS